MTKIGFSSELIQGHGGVTVVIVPFDPDQTWSAAPTKIDPRRDGWLVRGTVNGVRFAGWIGHRWGRYFIIVEPALRAAAKAAVGDTVEVVVELARGAKAIAEALAKATEQAKLTTAPRRRARR